MDEDFEDNLTKSSTWIRGLYILLFAVIFELSTLVTYAVAALQFLINLFTGGPNKRLQGFGGELSAYVRQIVSFLTYADELTPFPFSDWPIAGAKGATASKKKAPAAKKTTRKKKDAKS